MEVAFTPEFAPVRVEPGIFPLVFVPVPVVSPLPFESSLLISVPLLPEVLLPPPPEEDSVLPAQPARLYMDIITTSANATHLVNRIKAPAFPINFTYRDTDVVVQHLHPGCVLILIRIT